MSDATDNDSGDAADQIIKGINSNKTHCVKQSFSDLSSPTGGESAEKIFLNQLTNNMSQHYVAFLYSRSIC